MKELPFTGERFVPNIGGEIELEHISRYFFACNLIEGKKVLDIASGEGYGSAILARKATEVVGVEIAEDVVSFSQKKYADIANLSFRQGSCLSIPCEDDAFDVVVSFETLEHIEEHALFLSEIKRVLKQNGVLIISTPNTNEYSKDGYQNEFHALELNENEFKELLERNFGAVSYFKQNVGYVSYILPSEISKEQLSGVSVKLADDFPKKYLIAICKPISDSTKDNGIIYIDPKINLTEELHEGYKNHLNNWEKVANELRAEMADMHVKYGIEITNLKRDLDTRKDAFGANSLYRILSKIAKKIIGRS